MAVSAKTGEGFELLVKKIQDALYGGQQMVTLRIPYDRGDLSAYLCQKMKPARMEYREDGTCFEILLSAEDRSRFAEYVKDWDLPQA